jgi:hypothetical protein
MLPAACLIVATSLTADRPIALAAGYAAGRTWTR